MKDMLMVPLEEWNRLKTKHQAAVSQSALMDKVGDLGATEEIILNSNIPASMAVAMTKPLARKRRNVTKRLRTGMPALTSSYGNDPDDPEAMVDSPAEALLKRFLKLQQTPAPAGQGGPPVVTKQSPKSAKPGPSGTQKTKLKKKAKLTEEKILKEVEKGTLASLWPDSDDDDYEDPLTGSHKKKKGKQKKKKRKGELDQLQLDEPVKRGALQYGSAEDSDPALSEPEGWDPY